MNIEEFSKIVNQDLEIDRFSIEADWRKQPIIYFKWSKLLAQSRHELSKARENLSVIESALYIDVKINYDKHGYKNSPTEAAIRSITVQNDKYINAREIYSNLALKTELLSSAVKALEYKKSALDYLNFKPEMC